MLASAAARNADARLPGSSPPVFIIGREPGDARKVPRGTPRGVPSALDAGTSEGAWSYSSSNPPHDGHLSELARSGSSRLKSSPLV